MRRMRGAVCTSRNMQVLVLPWVLQEKHPNLQRQAFFVRQRCLRDSFHNFPDFTADVFYALPHLFFSDNFTPIFIVPQKILKKKPSFRFPQYHTSSWILEKNRDFTPCYTSSANICNYRVLLLVNQPPHVGNTCTQKTNGKVNSKNWVSPCVFLALGWRAVIPICSRISNLSTVSTRNCQSFSFLWNCRFHWNQLFIENTWQIDNCACKKHITSLKYISAKAQCPPPKPLVFCMFWNVFSALPNLNSPRIKIPRTLPVGDKEECAFLLLTLYIFPIPLNAYEQILFYIIMQPQKTLEIPLRESWKI